MNLSKCHWLNFFLGLVAGIHSVTTVSKVPVKTGGSISLPCLYESKYRNHAKYLCQGYRWSSCSYTVKTNEPRRSGRFSISDDKQQRIFTVTIDRVTLSDSHYWCIVEINNGADDGKRFQLSVTAGRPLLSVDHQEVTGFIGGDVAIRFTYSNRGEIQWCRLGGSCIKEPHGSIDGTRVTIDLKNPDVFNVTLKRLRAESSGWYYCAKGDVRMPVRVTVKERPITTTITTTEITTQLTNISLQPVNHTSAFANTTSEKQSERGPDYLLRFIIPASVLIVIVLVALIFWCVLRQHKLKKAQSSAAAKAEAELTYSVISHRRPNMEKQDPAPDEHVTYSTLAQH
uniref:Polymeric immunoglobulin receptor-like n=1 Tax=Labrus bergylta TaxID=56723 RepID=A0A3Q3F1T3_9LABR